MRKRFVFILVLAFLVSLSFIVAEDNSSNNVTGCIKESESIAAYPGQPDCCEGLIKIDGCGPVNGVCGEGCAGGVVCTKCGNDICGPGENICNCPSDCLSQNQTYISKTKCENSDGTWKTFNNGCADTCEYVRNPNNTVCTQAFTDSCDCGSEKCWTGNKCEKNIKDNDNETDSEDEDDKDNDCNDYRYSTCPDKCLKNCVPSVVSGGISTSDCEGEGSCYSLNENNKDEEDCWQCSKWSDCVNNTKTRTCTQIANCTNDDDEEEDETPKTVKKCEFGKKIKDYYINNECPEECTCTGSVIKCELASGRIMTIYAGKSGNVIIQIKGVNMSTSVNLYKDENGTLTGVFNNKTKIIKVLPDEARDKIKEKIKSIIEDEEINLDDYGFYKIKAHKKARFLLLIPVRENIEGQVDSETGDIIIIKKGSWWGFLARDVKE